MDLHCYTRTNFSPPFFSQPLRETIFQREQRQRRSHRSPNWKPSPRASIGRYRPCHSIVPMTPQFSPAMKVECSPLVGRRSSFSLSRSRSPRCFPSHIISAYDPFVFPFPPLRQTPCGSGNVLAWSTDLSPIHSITRSPPFPAPSQFTCPSGPSLISCPSPFKTFLLDPGAFVLDSPTSTR